jgi:hypothetical protein
MIHVGILKKIKYHTLYRLINLASDTLLLIFYTVSILMFFFSLLAVDVFSLFIEEGIAQEGLSLVLALIRLYSYSPSI